MWRDQIDAVAGKFDRSALQRICVMPEQGFADAYGLTTVVVEAQDAPDNFYLYRDNGADVLFVAHLDTVSKATARKARFVHTAAGLVVFSRALDDRLGAYIGLELLPKLGITYDVLLTVGEEKGMSTAAYFETDKSYDWVIEFDRGGTDVVMYQYEDEETCDMVEASGARVGDGTFSDISCMEHLGVKCFNWGVGYQDYHTARSHAFLDDTFAMVACYLRFHALHVGTYMAHYARPVSVWPGWWESTDGMVAELDDLVTDPTNAQVTELLDRTRRLA